MPVLIRDFLRNLNADQSPLLLPTTRKLYAKPTYTDIHVQNSAGQWQLWTVNLNISNPAYKFYTEVPLDPNTGEFSLYLPYTDTEMYRQAGGSILWEILDPDAGQVYKGSLASGDWSFPGIRSYSLKDILSDGVSDWVAVPANNVNGAFRGSVTFTNATTQEITVAISPSMANDDYWVGIGGGWDDLSTTLYGAALNTGSRTTSQFKIRISSLVPSGRSVDIYWEVQP